MMKKSLASIGAVAAGAVIILSGSSNNAAAASAVYDNGQSYTLETSFAFENKTPIAAPIWSADTDKPAEDSSRVIVSPVLTDNKLFYVKSGKLIARDMTKGKALWSFGAKLQGNTVVAAGEIIFVGDKSGNVFKVNPKTGKGAKIYQTKEKMISRVVADDKALYVFSGTKLDSINISSGKLNWSVPSDSNGSGNNYILDNILLSGAVESGALTVNTYYAFDKTTGKTLWRMSGNHGELLKADGNRLYFNDGWPRSDGTEYIAKVDIIHAKTGVLTASLKYGKPDHSIDNLVQSPKRITIEGNTVYIVTRTNEVLFYNLTSDPNAANAKSINADGEVIAGPYNGKFFFQASGNLGIHGRKLIDGTPMYYQGLDNPASQVNFAHSGMYVGQTDGEVYALNVATGKAKFRFQTDSRRYGPFQVAGNMLLVQTENKLYGFRLPGELVQPAGN
ncbi:PQQ enzyme repeat-containing protein [Paenibacillaceae bacterium GAS479]|nr:PQQ enzyme repeat-containing protein [Paenibacillaceae bacterium GAS479]